MSRPQVKGYRADVCVQQASEDENQCFITWHATWDEANAGIAALPKQIRGLIAAAEKAGACM